MGSPDQNRIFVVDDDASVRRGLARLLNSHGHETEVFASAEELLDRLPFDGLGCILLDVRMPGIGGEQLQCELNAMDSSLPIVFLTAHGDIPMAVRAMRRGAVDFLTKPIEEAALLPAIERALEAHRQELARRRERDSMLRRYAALSPREQEVVRHVVTGAPNKGIAARLGIAEKTVKIHRGRAMAKLQIDSVAELVRMCAVAGIEPAGSGDYGL